MMEKKLSLFILFISFAISPIFAVKFNWDTQDSPGPSLENKARIMIRKNCHKRMRDIDKYLYGIYFGEILDRKISDPNHPCSEIENLINAGADLNINGHYAGNTPLHWACIWGCKRCVNLIVCNGADLNIQNDCGNTPLHWLARDKSKDSFHILKLLIESGASLNIHNDCGFTAADVAKEYAQRDYVTNYLMDKEFKELSGE